MSDHSGGEGWWQASDGKWYPPELHPDARGAAEPPAGEPPAGEPPAGEPPAGEPVGGAEPTAPIPAVPPSAGPPPTGPPPAGPPPAPSGDGGDGGGGSARILIGVAVVAALALVAAVVLFLTGDDDDDDDVASVDTTATTEVADTTTTTEPDTTTTTTVDDADTTTTEPDTTTTEPDTTTTDGAEPPALDEGCEFVEVDDFGDIQVELTFENPLGEVGSLQVTYALLDGDGARFGTAPELVPAPRDGERFRLGSDSLTEVPDGVDPGDVACEILEIEEGFGDPPLAAPDSSCAFVEIDAFDDIQLDVTFTNPASEPGDVIVVIALTGPDDVRFASVQEFVELAQPGQENRLDVDTLTEAPAWIDDTDDIGCEVLGVERF